MKHLVVVIALLVALAAGVAVAAAPVEMLATLETAPFFDNDSDDSDADDPAIWVHAQNRASSIVIGTLKNGGLAVFDLAGRTIQRVDYADEDARQNNVDLLYGIRLGARRRDLAVVTDRGVNHLRVFAIDPAGSAASTPLVEVTEPDPPVIFTGDDEISAYGIAAWKGDDGSGYVAISQRHRTTLVLLRLVGGSRRHRRLRAARPPRVAVRVQARARGHLVAVRRGERGAAAGRGHGRRRAARTVSSPRRRT